MAVSRTGDEAGEEAEGLEGYVICIQCCKLDFISSIRCWEIFRDLSLLYVWLIYLYSRI